MPYLFSRVARLAPGNSLDSTAWSAKLTEKINSISELPVSLWTAVFSPGLGTLTWTSIVQDLSQLEALEAKLTVDSGYLSLVEEGARYTTDQGIDDSLVDLVFADPDATGGERQYATLVQSTLALGSSVHGIEVGVEIAQRAKKITGRPTSFGVSRTGVYGGVGWIAIYDSVDQVQAAGDALANDASFAKFLDDELPSCYLPGAATQAVVRRVV